LNFRLIALIGAVMAFAAIVAGCGSSSSTTESTASLSKAEFAKQGNAICKAGNKEVEAGFEEFSKEHGFSKKKQPTQAEFEEGAEEVVIPSVRKQIDEIKELGAPEGEEEKVEAFLENAEAQLEKGEEDVTLLVDENQHLFASVNEEGKALGLTACAEGES
jgi:predicted lipid-binding transport protein (Tim44 family)